MLGDISWPRWPRARPKNYTPSDREWSRWRFWGRRLRRTTTYKTLRTIEAARIRASATGAGGTEPVTWLVPYRHRLRHVYADFYPHRNEGEVDAIRCFMAYCDPRVLGVCIWLVGKCADRFRLYGLSRFADHPSPQVRRHVAKALRRVEAWSVLQQMARSNPDDARIRWYATAPTTMRPFRERLANYTRGVGDSHSDKATATSRMPYWAIQTAWQASPPKDVALIRRMLRRIRHWVRWGTHA